MKTFVIDRRGRARASGGGSEERAKVSILAPSGHYGTKEVEALFQRLAANPAS
jgi:hypothetical protein